MDVTVEGAGPFAAALRAVAQRMDRATGDAVNEGLRTLARQQRTLLGAGAHPFGTPTGAPPGSPPWRISGALRDSVTVRRAVRTGPGQWSGQMGPTSIYGRIQELGGVTGRGHRTRLPPRPSLYPAWRIVRPTLRDVYVARWREAQAA